MWVVPEWLSKDNPTYSKIQQLYFYQKKVDSTIFYEDSNRETASFSSSPASSTEAMDDDDVASPKFPEPFQDSVSHDSRIMTESLVPPPPSFLEHSATFLRYLRFFPFLLKNFE